ncbi:MAG: GtrA family protein [Casimicrobiaceae bacterium]
MVPQFFRYAGAGAIGTAAHFTVLVALVQLGGANAIAASTAGAAVGAVVNYAINHRFTFSSRKSHVLALPRFLAVALAGLALNAIVLAAMLAATDVNYVVAQLVATGAVLGITYLSNRAWTF